MQRGKVPIVVGGTGFYLRWCIHGKPQTPATTPEAAQQVQTLLAKVSYSLPANMISCYRRHRERSREWWSALFNKSARHNCQQSYMWLYVTQILLATTCASCKTSTIDIWVVCAWLTEQFAKQDSQDFKTKNIVYQESSASMSSQGHKKFSKRFVTHDCIRVLSLSRQLNEVDRYF